jgi:hypothetical protein
MYTIEFGPEGFIVSAASFRLLADAKAFVRLLEAAGWFCQHDMPEGL